jgi:hypothetical protein
VETGRWSGTHKDEITCHICKTGQIAEEFHYVNALERKSFEYYRRKYLCKKNIVANKTF